MNSTLQAVIDAGLAAVDRHRDVPVEPFAYGSDLSCGEDLDPEMTEISGSSPRVLMQALMRRLDCPRGSLPDDPDYGISIRDMLNSGVAQAAIPKLEGSINSELSKDDRVALVKAEVKLLSQFKIRVRIRVTPVDSSGSFSLTLAITPDLVVLEEISR